MSDSIDDPMRDAFGILELVFGDEVTGPPSRPSPPFFLTPAGDGVFTDLFDILEIGFLFRLIRFNSILKAFTFFLPLWAKRKWKENIEVHIRYDVTIFLKLAKHVYAPRALRANSSIPWLTVAASFTPFSH